MHHGGILRNNIKLWILVSSPQPFRVLDFELLDFRAGAWQLWMESSWREREDLSGHFNFNDKKKVFQHLQLGKCVKTYKLEIYFN